MPTRELKIRLRSRAWQFALRPALMRSPIDLAAEAIANALDDAASLATTSDGMAVSFGSPIGADGDSIAPMLGLNLRAFTQTWGARPLHRKLYSMGRDGRQRRPRQCRRLPRVD